MPVRFVIAYASADISDVAAAQCFSQMAAAGATPVAVRSSAVGEDGDNQSFAGQYDTVLGVDSVDDFTEAVRACTASVHSERASSYSGESAAIIHLVVQQMVDARAAGVVFSAYALSAGPPVRRSDAQASDRRIPGSDQ